MNALYLHIPFCSRKCPYCDFYSVSNDHLRFAGYADLLIRHLQLARQQTEPGPLKTIFFGGGTPSLLPPAKVDAILKVADELFGIAADAEISLEANPGTVSAATLAGYRAAGVNRLSLGIQSLQPNNLQLLGRIHSAADARQAAHLARSAGFSNLSLDLMFALPGQNLDDLHREIDELLALQPGHLSCYGLSIEERTPFYHLHRSGGLEIPCEEKYVELFLALHERLTQAGYLHYEISNYARPGQECRHNLGYWQRQPYLGVGAGAHSFSDRDWGVRLAVPPDLERYARLLATGTDPAEVLETFDHRGAMAETLYLGLRTAAGVDDLWFRQRFGMGVAEAFPNAVAKTADRLRFEAGLWSFDLDGWLLYDHFITPFL